MDRPSLLQIYQRVDQDLDPRLRNSSKSVLSKALAGCSHLLHGYSEEKSKSLHPLKARGSVLDDWAAIFLEKGRKEPSKATGIIEVSSTAPITLERHMVFRYGDIQFLTDNDELVNGKKEIKVTAKKAGQIELVRDGSVLVLVVETTKPNLESSAKVISMGRGSDLESDESLKERILERVRNPPQGGAPQDYIAWAKEVPGISRAWVAPRFNGLGNVAVAFVNDETGGGISTEADKTALENKLAGVAPAGAKVTAYMLNPEPLHFVIKADPVSIKPQVEQELRTLLRQVSEPVLSGDNYFLNSRMRKTTGILPVSEIHEVLALIPKEAYKLIHPMEDIKVSEGKIFTFGGLNVLPI